MNLSFNHVFNESQIKRFHTCKIHVTNWLKKLKKNTIKEIVIKTVQFDYKNIAYPNTLLSSIWIVANFTHWICFKVKLTDSVLNTMLTEMTFPRADRDLLILAPSLSRSPVAPVLSALSDPAKSTRFITLLFLVSDPDSLLMIWSNVMVTTVWALLLVAFMLVEATVRLAVPMGELIKYKHKSKFFNSLWIFFPRRNQ